MSAYDTIRAAVTRQRDQLEHPWPDYYVAYLQLREAGFTGPQSHALADGGYRILSWVVIP